MLMTRSVRRYAAVLGLVALAASVLPACNDSVSYGYRPQAASVTVGGEPAGGTIALGAGDSTRIAVTSTSGGPYVFTLENRAVAMLSLEHAQQVRARERGSAKQTLTSHDGEVRLIGVRQGKTTLAIFVHGSQVYTGEVTITKASPSPTPSPTPMPSPTPTPKPAPMTVAIACAESVDVCSNGSASTPGSVQFTAVGHTATLTPREGGPATTFTLTSDACNKTDDPSATGNWATISPSIGKSGAVFTVTARNGGTSSNPATCTAILSDGHGQTVTVNVAVTLGSIGVH